MKILTVIVELDMTNEDDRNFFEAKKASVTVPVQKFFGVEPVIQIMPTKRHYNKKT